jgi:hypothetical protein
MSHERSHVPGPQINLSLLKINHIEAQPERRRHPTQARRVRPKWHERAASKARDESGFHHATFIGLTGQVGVKLVTPLGRQSYGALTIPV